MKRKFLVVCIFIFVLILSVIALAACGECQHIGGTATCTRQAVCEKCNEPYGAYDDSDHVNLAWEKTETTHAQKCNGCGAVVVSLANHSWQSGVCTVCGYQQPNQSTSCSHSGGTATCTQKATCSLCGQTYGDFNKSNHSGQLVWEKTATKHKKYYSCCNSVVVDMSNHSWQSGVCTVCQYGCQHSGGTATCTQKATCSLCGQTYGDFNKSNHSGQLVWEKTATKHKKYYSCCNSVVVDMANHSWQSGVCTVCQYGCQHSGGTATCISQAVCQKCNTPYGEYSNEHTYQNNICIFCGHDLFNDAISVAKEYIEFVESHNVDFPFVPADIIEHLQEKGFEYAIAYEAAQSCGLDWVNYAKVWIQPYLVYKEAFDRPSVWWAQEDIEIILLDDDFSLETVRKAMQSIDWLKQGELYVEHLADYYSAYSRFDAKIKLKDCGFDNSEVIQIIYNCDVNWQTEAYNMIISYFNEFSSGGTLEEMENEMLNLWEFTSAEINYALNTLNISKNKFSWCKTYYLAGYNVWINILSDNTILLYASNNELGISSNREIVHFEYIAVGDEHWDNEYPMLRLDLSKFGINNDLFYELIYIVDEYTVVYQEKILNS